MKLLTALFMLLNTLATMWREKIVREQGRQQAHKEAADEIERQVELAEYAATADDPDRTERLRARFDDDAGG